MLDKCLMSWYNNQAHRESDERPRTDRTWKKPKKVQKTLKKGIDKRERMWYNNKVAAIVAAEMILENWTTREKYKAYLWRTKYVRTNSIQKRILLKQK